MNLQTSSESRDSKSPCHLADPTHFSNINYLDERVLTMNNLNIRLQFLRMLLIGTVWLGFDFAQAQECSSETVKQATKRVYTDSGQLQDVFFEQDLELARTCMESDDPKAIAHDDEITNDFERLRCFACESKCRNDKETLSIKGIEVPLCVRNGGFDMEYYRREARGAEWKPFMASGGIPFAWLLGHIGKKGHYEVTQLALDNYAKEKTITLSSSAKELISRAATDTDWYDWTTPAAHAQMPNNDAGQLLGSSKEAYDAFVKWTNEGMSKAHEKCLAGNDEDALYLLGYSLHALQDLVFHEGMSNAEHAYRDAYKSRIDTSHHFDEKFADAVDATTRSIGRFFEQQKKNGLAVCRNKILSWKGQSSLTSSQKLSLVGRKERDLTFNSWNGFKNLRNVLAKNAFCETCSEVNYILKDKWLGWDDLDLHSISHDVVLKHLYDAIVDLFKGW